MAVRQLSETTQLESDEFLEFRDYLQKTVGINFGLNKQYLVATRIRKILHQHNFKSLRELTCAIQNASNRAVRQQVIDAMTTNETLWFRDGYPFEFLRHMVLPEFLNKTPHDQIRIWSAACSYGQEPYSISMVIEEFARNVFGGSNLQAEIVATDLSTAALTTAMRGEYDSMSIARGLTGPRLRSHFDIVDRDVWRVKADIQNRVKFRQLNLQDGFAAMGKFELILCRNVLIYFSEDLKNKILNNMSAALKPGGYLILGSSESATVNSHFDVVHFHSGVVYRRK